MQISSYGNYSSYYNNDLKSLEQTKNTQDEDTQKNSSAKSTEEEPTKEKKTKEKQDPNKLSPEEEEQVKKLQKRDTEVRAHEAAHIAAGGGVVTGGASFSYQKGPDGRSYAVGGEVPIDMSTESSPEATISKMQKVKVAAMAPADPSPQDYKVAATATILEMQARVELMQEKTKENEEKNGDKYKQSDDKDLDNKLDLSV